MKILKIEPQKFTDGTIAEDAYVVHLSNNTYIAVAKWGGTYGSSVYKNKELDDLELYTGTIQATGFISLIAKIITKLEEHYERKRQNGES